LKSVTIRKLLNCCNGSITAAKLGAYLRPHWRQATLGILALFVVNALVYIPLLIRNIIDKLQITFSFDQVLSYVVLIAQLRDVGNPDGIPDHPIWVGRQVEFDLKQRFFNTC